MRIWPLESFVPPISPVCPLSPVLVYILKAICNVLSYYSSVSHMQHPVAHGSQLLIMRNNQKSLPQVFSQFKKQLMQITGIGCIQISGRFVGKNNEIGRAHV